MRRRGHKLFLGFVLTSAIALMLHIMILAARNVVKRGIGEMQSGNPFALSVSNEEWMFLAALVLAGIVWYALIGAHKLRVRRKQPTADEALAEDQRPPVLVLRSFAADAIAQKKLDAPPLFDQILTETLETRIGPVIAIGDPRDDLAPTGANRLYVDKGSWRTAVTEYLKIAQLVVIQAGLSKGVLWEIKSSIKHVKPQRLLIIFLGDDVESMYAEFRKRTSKIFPRPLPKSLGESTYLYFGPRWGAKRLLLPDSENVRQGENAFLAFIYSHCLNESS